MKLSVFDLECKEAGKIEMPLQFQESVRQDLIKRAFESIRANGRQRYGATPLAGKKYAPDLSRRRRHYRGSYGFGISRIPRKILVRRGTRMYWVGAQVPGTVGGRRAHPPKSEKQWARRLNTKERRKAIRAALSATIDKSLAEARGHFVPQNYPFVISEKYESLSKTKQVTEALARLGFSADLNRAKPKTIRAGKGKARGRRYLRKKSLLIVVSRNEAELSKSARNIPGVDVVQVDRLNVELLAPGGMPGRATLFTESAIKVIEEKNLFK
ncbi:MAG TPA: 50S ribosomal protein L4 [Candidatus Woesearchaeota archaeon]|nr:50S ribosomal protein L4 [Candidatus Woesearchaeota archaeon]